MICKARKLIGSPPEQITKFMAAQWTGFRSMKGRITFVRAPRYSLLCCLGKSVALMCGATTDTRITLGCWQDMKRDIIQRAFDNLAPGGYLECQEIDPLLHCDDKSMRKSFAPRKFFKLLVETSHDAERPLDIAEHLAGWLRDVGFMDVHEEVFQIPISGWPRESKKRDLGRAQQENLLSGLSAFSLGLLTRFGGMSEEEVQVSEKDPQTLYIANAETYFQIAEVGRCQTSASRRICACIYEFPCCMGPETESIKPSWKVIGTNGRIDD
jgi:hypothetical protein